MSAGRGGWEEGQEKRSNGWNLEATFEVLDVSWGVDPPPSLPCGETETSDTVVCVWLHKLKGRLN